jgi:hypothetical protein
MDVALPYASWDSVRMKWRPSLKGSITILGLEEPVGC